tara:strand:- start:3690 stop:4679 length:990 start_codon:yes stop_codon:yes gene_type:complete
MIRCILSILILSSFNTLSAQWKKIELPITSGHRALAILPNQSVLLAGSKGSVALYNPISGIVTNSIVDTVEWEYRASSALSDSVLLIANAGSPAHIYRSTNAGESWEKVYSNNHASAFIDGMVMLNDDHLFAYGDQINNRFLFLESTDGGETWAEANLPIAKDTTDAGFAASNAGILVVGDSLFIAISGRKDNYILCSPNKGITWHSIQTDMQTGEGAGTFAMAYDNGKLILAGGSYLTYKDSNKNIQILDPKTGVTTKIVSAPRGYRSGIDCHNGTCISTGTLGTDISYDGGINWTSLMDERYFAVKHDKGQFYLSGPKGSFATFRRK